MVVVVCLLQMSHWPHVRVITVTYCLEFATDQIVRVRQLNHPKVRCKFRFDQVIPHEGPSDNA